MFVPRDTESPVDARRPQAQRRPTVRELYAVELRPIEASDVVHTSSQQAIAEWATRPFEGLSGPDILKQGEFLTPSGRIQTLSGKDGGWVLRWWQENQTDSSPHGMRRYRSR